MKKVSVIMPCWNDGLYLEDAFQSVERQTWRNVEIVVVDDGSDDPYTRQQLERLSREKRCILLSQTHKGPAAARNLAVQHSSGAYILPLDADDAIAPDYIEKAVCVLEREPEVGVCYCRADFWGAMKGPWMLPDYSLAEMLKDNVVFVSSVMRREVFEHTGGYDERFMDGMEDYDFYLTVIEQGWEVYQLPETLFHYRIKPGSRSQTFSGKKEVYRQVYRTIYEKHKKLYCAHAEHIIPELREEVVENRQKIQELQEQIRKKRRLWEKVADRILSMRRG